MADDMEADDQDYVKVPDINGAEAAKKEGNELYKQKKYEAALEKYSEAHEKHPTNAIYLGNRSAVYMTMEKFGLALRDSKEATNLDDKYVKGYARQIKCNVALGNLAAAKSTCDEIRSNVKLDGDFDTIFKTEIAQIRSLESNLEQARQAETAKNYRQAAFYYKKAHEIALGDTNLHVSFIKNTALSGQVIEAHKFIFDVLQKNSTDAFAILVRGICFYLEDQTEKALNHFTQALRLAPDLVEAKEFRVKCKELQKIKDEGNEAFKSSNFDKAIEVYTKALDVDPSNKITNAKLYFNRALARSKVKESDPEKSEKRDLLVIGDCNKALDLDPTYVKAYRRRGYAYQNVDEHEKAVRDFEKVLELEPKRENKQAVQEAKRKQKLAERKDYYKILKVTKEAEEKEIKKAYRKQALLHHPDRHANATEEEKAIHEKNFKDVNEAWTILSDPTKKQRYDNGQDIDGSGMGGFSGGDIDPNLIFQQFFGGGGGMGGMGGFGGGGGRRGGGGQEFVFSFG